MNKKKILIVEDELIVAKNTEQQLENLGYQIPAIANNADDAIRMTGRYLPDLVLMDVKLNGSLDGITAAKTIHARYDIPIIYVTALANENILQQAHLTHPFAYVIKPYEIQELHSNIQAALLRRNIEYELKESEAKYRQVVENQSELICHFRSNYRISFINHAFARFFKKPKQALIGSPITDLIPEDQKDSIQDIIHELNIQNQFASCVIRHIFPAKEIRWVQWHCQVLIDQQGKPETFQAIGRDISEIKNAQEALIKRDVILSAISNITENLFQTGNSWKKSVENVLGNFAPAINAETVYIYRLISEEDQPPSLSRQFDWSSPGISNKERNRQSIDFLALLYEAESWFEKFQRRQVIKIDISNKSKIIEPLNVNSCLLVPIIIDEKCWGFIGFGSRNEIEQWHTLEEDALKIATNIIGTAIQRQQLDDIRRNHENILRGFIEQSTDGIWLTDENCMVAEWNREMEQFSGLSAKDVIGEKLWDVFYSLLPASEKKPQSYQNIKKTLLHILQKGIFPSKKSLVEDTIYTSDGRKKVLQTQYFSMIGNHSHLLCGIVRDITDFQQLNRQIDQSKSEWEATFQSVSEMIVLTDHEGNISRCNQATLNTLQIDQDQIVGKNIDLVFLGNEYSENSLLSGQREIQFPNIKGIFNVSTYPLYLDKKRSGLIFIITDVTVNKEIEEVVNASQKLSSLSTLAAGISHEINSPLQVIIGNSESLLKRLQTDHISQDQMVKSLESIHRNGWRVAEIIRSLQVYAYSLTGNLKPCSLNDLVRNALRITQHVHFFNINRCIVTELSPGLPPVMCNEADITQVLVNLISNAVDATPDGGGIEISTSEIKAENKILFRIHDNGTGIPEAVRSQIFDPFYTTKPVGKGVGLGLSIAMGIVKAHGGDIILENNAQKGSTFLVYLPLNPAHLIDPENERQGQGRFERYS